MPKTYVSFQKIIILYGNTIENKYKIETVKENIEKIKVSFSSIECDVERMLLELEEVM